MSAGPKNTVSKVEVIRLREDILNLRNLRANRMPTEESGPIWSFLYAMTMFDRTGNPGHALTKYAAARAAADAWVPAADVDVSVDGEKPVGPTPAVGICTAEVDRGSDERHCDDAPPEGYRATNAGPGPTIEDASRLLKTINGAGRFLKSEERAPMVAFIEAMATYAAAGKDGNTSPVLEAYAPALGALVALGIAPEGAAEKPVEPTPAVGITGTADVDRQNDGPHGKDAVPEGGGTMSTVPEPAVTLEKATRLRQGIRDQWFHFSKLEQAPMLPFMQAMGDFNYGSKRGRDVDRALAEYAHAHAALAALATAAAVEALAAAERPLEPLGKEGDASPVLKAFPTALDAPGVVPERAAERLDEKPVESPAATGPAAQAAEVDPNTLLPHLFNAEVFGGVLIETHKQEAFEQDIAAHGVTKPVIVTGAGCHSPPNTILAGHRRAIAAGKAGLRVMVVVRNGLTELGEITLLARDNLADQHARGMSEKQMWLLEAKVRELQRKGRGHRTDLASTKINLDSSLSKSRAPKTNELVAEAVTRPAGAVADRDKIFASPLSTPALEEAVDGGLVPRSAAATLVRSLEKELGPHMDPAACDAAKAKLNEQLEDMAKKKTGSRKKRARKSAPEQQEPVARATEAAIDGEPWEHPERSAWATTKDKEKLLELCKRLSDDAWSALHGLWFIYARQAQAHGRKVPDGLLAHVINAENGESSEDVDAVRVAEALRDLLGPLASPAFELLVEAEIVQGDPEQAPPAVAAVAPDFRQRMLADHLASKAGAEAAAAAGAAPDE